MTAVASDNRPRALPAHNAASTSTALAVAEQPAVNATVTILPRGSTGLGGPGDPIDARDGAGAHASGLGAPTYDFDEHKVPGSHHSSTGTSRDGVTVNVFNTYNFHFVTHQHTTVHNHGAVPPSDERVGSPGSPRPHGAGARPSPGPDRDPIDVTPDPSRPTPGRSPDRTPTPTPVPEVVVTGPAAAVNQPATGQQLAAMAAATAEHTAAMGKFAAVDGKDVKSATHEFKVPGRQFETYQVTFSKADPNSAPVVTVRMVSGHGGGPDITVDISDSFSALPKGDRVTRDQWARALAASKGSAALLNIFKGAHLTAEEQKAESKAAFKNNSVLDYLVSDVPGATITKMVNTTIDGYRGTLRINGVVDRCHFTGGSIRPVNGPGQKAIFVDCSVSGTAFAGCDIKGSLEFDRCSVSKNVIFGVGYDVKGRPGESTMTQVGGIKELNIRNGTFRATLDVYTEKLNITAINTASYVTGIPILGFFARTYVNMRHSGMIVTDRAGEHALATVKPFSHSSSREGYNPSLTKMAEDLLAEGAELYRLLPTGKVQAVTNASELNGDAFLVKAGKHFVEVDTSGTTAVGSWTRPPHMVTFRKLEVVGDMVAGVTEATFIEPGKKLKSSEGLAMLRGLLDHAAESPHAALPRVPKRDRDGVPMAA